MCRLLCGELMATIGKSSFSSCSKNFMAAGETVTNRIFLPMSFTTEKLERGDYSFRQNGNLLVLRFQDKKVVTMLSGIAGKVFTGKFN